MKRLILIKHKSISDTPKIFTLKPEKALQLVFIKEKVIMTRKSTLPVLSLKQIIKKDYAAS